MREFDTLQDSRLLIEAALAERVEEQTENLESTVRDIIRDVRERGDDAVVELTRRFDWPDASREGLEISRDELETFTLAAPDGDVPRHAAENISAFHTAELRHLQTWMQPETDGRMLGQLLQPVKRVGIYVPGGKAFYPSTVLMTAIPATIAGVEEIVLCTPAGKDGSIHPLILAVAAPYVHRVFKIGGAQAIAAMAYGTETVPKVDIIVGPGNQYVNTAKRMVYGTVGIDMLAGPSEVGIVADENANPAFIAADLLAQTEHGPENRGVLFSSSSELLAAVGKELERQRALLSRQEILAHTEGNLIFVKTQTIDEAMELSNVLAPEHLELFVSDPKGLLPLVRNAGAVLLGEYTSAPIGDYIAGPSHTLPTAGAARFSSPLSVATFMKRTSVIQYSARAAHEAADQVGWFADAEGFDAHAAAARMRKASN